MLPAPPVVDPFSNTMTLAPACAAAMAAANPDAPSGDDDHISLQYTHDSSLPCRSIATRCSGGESPPAIAGQ